MSNAAVTTLNTAAATVTGPYRCDAEGCIGYTGGHYCAAHVERCADCSTEVERGSLIAGSCEECLARECGLDVEDYGEACRCGRHNRLTQPTLVELAARRGTL